MNLAALACQTLPPDRFEVIVVNDASTDDTRAFLDSHRPPFRMKVVHRERGGDMQFYNVGAREAVNDVMLFIDDDVIAAPGLLAAHLETHNRFDAPVGVIGRLRWPPGMKLSPFDDYVGRSGMLMGTHLIENPDDVHFKFTLTGNFSVPKKAFDESGGFDADIGVYGYIDTEFGYRLGKEHGVRLVYNSEAVADHYGTVALDKFLKRRELCGSTAVIFASKRPELARYLKVELAGRCGPGGIFFKAVLRAAHGALRPFIPFLERLYPASRAPLFFIYRLCVFHNYLKGIGIYLKEVEKHGTNPFPEYPGR